MDINHNQTFTSPPSFETLLDISNKELAIGNTINNLSHPKHEQLLNLQSELSTYVTAYKYTPPGKSYPLTDSLIENWISALREMGNLRREIADDSISEIRNRIIDQSGKLQYLNDELRTLLGTWDNVVKSQEQRTDVLRTFDILKGLWDLSDQLLALDGVYENSLAVLDFIVEKFGIDPDPYDSIYKSVTLDVIREQIDALASFYITETLLIDGYDSISDLKADIKTTTQEIETQLEQYQTDRERIYWLENIIVLSTYDEDNAREHGEDTDNDNVLDYSVDEPSDSLNIHGGSERQYFPGEDVDGDELPDLSVDEQTAESNGQNNGLQTSNSEENLDGEVIYPQSGVIEIDVDGDHILDLSMEFSGEQQYEDISLLQTKYLVEDDNSNLGFSSKETHYEQEGSKYEVDVDGDDMADLSTDEITEMNNSENDTSRQNTDIPDDCNIDIDRTFDASSLGPPI